MTQQQLISIIIPIYNEAPNLSHLHKALKTVLSKLPYRFEFIFVDDGSHDDSVERLKRLAKSDRRIRIITFARNFGKEIATSAGIHAARGNAALMIDADLQHPPSLIPQFIEKWQKGAEVVVGIKQYSREEGWFKTFSSHCFYRLLRLVTTAHITPHASDFRLIDRKAINVFNRFTERNRLTRGIIDWVGFRRKYIYFEAPPRLHGKATYSYRKLFQLAFNSITAYSLLPLKFAGYLGSAILFLSTLLGLFVVVENYMLGDPYGLDITGTAILAILILFLIGMVLVCMGFVALYIARIHDEVTNRPLYVVKEEEEVENA